VTAKARNVSKIKQMVSRGFAAGQRLAVMTFATSVVRHFGLL
jgi:hypothetical protein